MASVVFNIKHKMSMNLLVSVWWLVSTVDACIDEALVFLQLTHLGDGSIFPLGVLIKLI
jgi:hypothetical protein